MLAVAAALVGAFGGSVARAEPATAIVYGAIPNLLPPNMASVGFQATQTSEFGDDVHLAGVNRALRTVTVTMSDWALYSDYSSDPRYSANSATWSHPITLSIYKAVSGTPLNTVGALLGRVTQTLTIPWRPAADPTCPGGTAWRAGDGHCYNGLASNITFDLGSLNVTLPNDVIVGIAYNTQSYGANPIGTPGPYNSLNVGVEGSATVGADDNTDRVFWSTSTAAWYTDHGTGGVGIFREDTQWGTPSVSIPEGTVPIQITAAPAVPSDVYVNPTWASVPTGQDPDGSGPASQMGYDAFTTIQAGVNAVAANGTVNVDSGSYAESVAIAKSLTLVGTGATKPVISGLAPASYIVKVDTTNGVTLDNLAIDGSGSAEGANAFSSGILVNNAGTGGSPVEVRNATVEDIWHVGAAGILVMSSGATPSYVDVHANTISSFDKYGMRFVLSSGRVHDSEIVGDNVDGHSRVQDLIALWGGSNVEIYGNILRNALTLPGDIPTWSSPAVLVTGYNTDHSVAASTANIHGNQIYNDDTGIGVGSAFTGAGSGVDGTDLSFATITGNDIHDVNVGVSFEQTTATATITGNTFGAGITTRVLTTANNTSPDFTLPHSPVVTATRNWWGQVTGPAGGQIDPSITPTTTPWCTDAACSTLSDNADLTSLSLSSVTLSPAFSSSTTAYSAGVGSSVTGVTVIKSTNPGANAVVTGGSTLSVGDNTVTVTVTSADGATTKTYTVVVNRALPSSAALSSKADLAGMSVSSGSLSPEFSSSVTSYSVAVDNGVTAVVVSAAAADAAASVAVSGGSDLVVGDNTVSVKVTAADGSVKTYTVTIVRAAAPVAGAASAVTAAPEQPGTVSVVVAATASAAGATTPTLPPVSVVASWPANTFAVPVEVTMTPQEPASAAGGGPAPAPTPIAGGFSVGSTVVQLTVTDVSTGAPVTSFLHPIKIHLSAIQPGDTPAYSHDGVTWTTIPQLSSPELPSGQQDGYVLNADGSVDIYTLHATLFGLLTDAQAPVKPTVKASVGGSKLYLLIRSKDNVRVAGYRVTLNGRLVKSTVRAYLVMPAHAGKYQVIALDANGNKSKPSATIKIVRTGNKKRPFKLTS